MPQTMYEKLFKSKQLQYNEFVACNNYLNNALRCLLRDENPYRPLIANAIAEICWCIGKLNGEYTDDVAKRLAETGLCPYKQ